LAGGATPQATDLGLTYANGPLAVSFSSLSRSATDAQALVAAKTTALEVAAVAATAKSTYNTISANYAIGAAKLFGGYSKGSKSATGGLDSEVTRFGASYKMGAITLIGQYAQAEIGTEKRKATGLRAENALSKRTTAYVAYEAYDSGKATANKMDTMAIGVRHAF
jgi:predicted porin